MGKQSNEPYTTEYPFFFSQELLDEYREYRKSNCDFKVMFLLYTLSTSFFFVRCNIFNHFNDGFYFSCSFGCTVISFFLCLIFITIYFLKTYGIDGKFFISDALPIWFSKYFDSLFEDAIAIVGTLGVSLGLYARVANGRCKENVTLWESQRCNTGAGVSALPLDHALFLFLLPTFCQSLINGMSFRATIIVWVIGTAAAAISLVHLNSLLEIFSMIAPCMIIVITYRFEKLTRTTFSNNRKTAAAEMEKQKYILLQQQAEQQLLFEMNKHELVILAMKAEEECRLMEKEKEQMVALIGNIAHDLKTPLQSFLVDLEQLRSDADYSRYLDAEPDDANGPRSILTTLESTCRFMSMSINRSIDFAKASRNLALVPRMETINLTADLSKAVNVIRHLKSSLEITVSPLPATMCLNIITDKHWFAENILCLLSNAVKYSNGGTVTVTIKHQLSLCPPESEFPSMSGSKDETDTSSSLSLLDTDCSNNGSSDEADRLGLSDHSTIQISVEDSGIGISEKACKDLFQPFKQVQRLAGGTGLGLYSLSNRIRALNGSRGVTARPDGKQGSVFWFSIPYRPDPHFLTEPREDGMKSPDPIRSPRASDGSITPEHAGTPTDISSLLCSSASSMCQKRRLYVLLVDDSPSILKVVGRALRSKAYDVVTAENGSAGLDLLINEYAIRKFDVVLMDLQMPIMDGIEAVRRYREFESTHLDKEDGLTGSTASRLFIIGMSANSDAATKQCASDVGMDEFLAKPFTIAELQPLIEHATSARAAQFESIQLMSA